MNPSLKPADSKSLPIIITHIVVILFAYTSPYWLDWRLVAAGIALYYVQIALFGGCVLSLAQFKGEKKSFHEWYLTRLGFTIDRAQLRFFLDRVLPFLFLLLALLLQVILHISPLITLK
jgi:hypothetical protein